MTLAQQKSSNSLPEFLVSYSGFHDNEKHLLNHYRQVYDTAMPYHILDHGETPSKKVDIVNTTCPCAGLSQLSHGFGTDNPNNQWMLKTTKYVLEEMQPEVFWGENAPGLMGKIGESIRNQLYQIALDNKYSMSMFRTKSILHGNPQIRTRSFYFFWKSGRNPVLSHFTRPHERIETLLRRAGTNFQMEPISSKTPSKDDPYYRFILEEMFGGITHREFANEKIEFMGVRSNDTFSFIEMKGYDYKQVGAWLSKNGYDNEAEKCKYKYDKLAAGKNIMRRGTIIPYDCIGAFVGHYPNMLTHPDEDRYITYREAMTIMGLPSDFELLDPKKSTNHICQNVPLYTALDMADEVTAALDGKRDFAKADLFFQYNTGDENHAAGSSLADFLS